ncbi:MAG: glycosyltransferase family protein [Phycisphaeraceae bacterium]
MIVQGLCYDATGKLRDNLTALNLYREQIEAACDLRLINGFAASLEQARKSVEKASPDVLFLCPEWHTPIDDARRLLDTLRSVRQMKIVLVDFCDGSNSPFFDLLTVVDLFIKAHSLSDPLANAKAYDGGHIFADFLVNQLGWDIGDWSFGSPADPAQVGKIKPGWTWAVHARYRALARTAARVLVPWRLRRIDLNTRFGGIGGNDDWYSRYRSMSLEKVRELAGRARLSSSKRVGVKRYLAEMAFTKIAFSPFGWGEVCFRDFEAVACGALLVKPDMGHLKTCPDLYRPHETYVPVKWDLSDLEETLLHYLDRPREAMKIASAAQKCLQRFYRDEQFVDRFRSYLRMLEAPQVK